MKFITEDDLRDTYKKEPFTTYDIEPGTRLTPGARQFLADRGIVMIDDEPWVKKYVVTSSDDPVKETPKSLENKKCDVVDWKKKKLLAKMKSTEALFLSMEQQLLQKDVLIAQNVINVSKEFSSIRKFAEGGTFTESVCVQKCTGINEENLCCDLGDCFEITEFHLQLEKSKEIVGLHRLRCELRELEPIVYEAYTSNDNEEDINLCHEIVRKINKLINVLSHMICMAVGGKECQRRD